MNTKPQAYTVGGGIGSLAGAFMIRDGKVAGPNTAILEEVPSNRNVPTN